MERMICLTIGLGNTLSLVLLLDGIRVRRALRRVHDLIGQALSNRLDVAERGLARAGGEQIDGMVDTAQRRAVARLPPHRTAAAHARRVLAGTAVDHRFHVHLHRVLLGEEVDDLKGVLDDANRHDFLAVVAAMAHHRAHHALNDRALGLAKGLLLPAALRVRQELRVLRPARNVVLERHILDLDILKGPAAKEFHLGSILARHVCSDALRTKRVGRGQRREDALQLPRGVS